MGRDSDTAAARRLGSVSGGWLPPERTPVPGSELPTTDGDEVDPFPPGPRRRHAEGHPPRSARRHLGPGVVGVPLALVVAAVVVGLVVLLAGGRVEADQGLLLAATAAPSAASVAAPGGHGTVVAPSTAAVQPVPGPAAPPEPSGPTGQPPATSVTVHVVGAVLAPGLVELPGAARVADALEAAGGPAADADLARVNLARPLVDGEQVLVPRPGEVLEGAPAVAPLGPAGPGPVDDGGRSGAAAGPVDLNTAGVAELDTLPGVGPVLAQRIVAWRTEVGPFASVEDLTAVSGIGDALVAGLAGVATV